MKCKMVIFACLDLMYNYWNLMKKTYKRVCFYNSAFLLMYISTDAPIITKAKALKYI